MHKSGGYTWNRGTCYSRLNYIFISNTLIVKSEQDWSYESSDHAAVKILLNERSKIVKGPGIIKVNSKILNDPKIVKQIENEIKLMMDQTDDSWNPHARLEFLKVAIRSVFSNKTSEIRKSLNKEVEELEEETNQLDELKINILEKEKDNPPLPPLKEKVNKIDIAIHSLKGKLQLYRTRISETLTFKSKTKWFEYGEKPNKFFLNLTKCRQNQRLITSLNSNTRTLTEQDDIKNEIVNFYKDLYKIKPRTNIIVDNFYDNCPKLTDKQAESLDKELTLDELRKALKTCKDSSPGPDGIPYTVYNKLWNIAGPIILNSWNYSTQNKVLPPSHCESVITLLPKDGKDI
jgi:hypothetical protein